MYFYCTPRRAAAKWYPPLITMPFCRRALDGAERSRAAGKIAYVIWGVPFFPATVAAHVIASAFFLNWPPKAANTVYRKYPQKGSYLAGVSYLVGNTCMPWSVASAHRRIGKREAQPH